MDSYGDACPVCPPGDAPSSPPVGTPQQAPGGLLTAHQCEVCQSAWETFWWRGWPVERLLAPVAPDRAARNRDALEQATRRDAA